MEGWLKLHRKLTAWEWYKDVPVKTLFIHLLICANYQPTRYQGKEYEAGELITTLGSLADGCGLSIRQTRTALDKLESTGEIVRTATNKITLIKVLKYADYQAYDLPERQTNDKQMTNERQTNDKQMTNDNTILKEIKNTRNKEIKNITSERAREAFLKSCPDVLLTDEQAEELLTRLSLDEFHTYMENLQDYISAGHKVHNPYQTILKWVERDRAV